MSMQTQIRRTVASFATLFLLAGFALAQGRLPEVALGDTDVAAACDVPAEIEAVQDTVSDKPAPVRANWRAHLPATIARSRS